MADDLQSTKIAWFETSPAVIPAELIGVWRGEGMPSGHPLAGVLENLQWFGKRFHRNLRADALLLEWRLGRHGPILSSFFPVKLIVRLARFGRTSIARNWFSDLQKVVRAHGGRRHP